MTTTGSGVGGNIGGPQQLSSKEIEATAWALVTKERMGVVQDTLEIPFTQVGGNIWKYSSDSTRPTLMPLGGNRTMGEEQPPPDESWKDNMDELMDQLPPQLKARMQSELAKTFEFRNPNLMLFGNTLTALAKGMAWMDDAEQPVDPQTAEGERTLDNLSLGGVALRGVVNQSQAELEGAESFLKDVGPNDPDFDKLYQFTQRGGALQKRMNEYLEILKDPGHPLPTQAQKDGLCQDIGKLAKEFDAISSGSRLQILGTMLETMEAVAQALSLTPSAPALFLGLKTALKGIFQSESEAGIFGENLEMLLNALQNGLAGSLLKNAGPAKLKMMMMMLMSALGGFGALAALVSQYGTGRFPAEDEDEEEEGKKFNFLLILKLLMSSRFVKLIVSLIAGACGQGEEKQQQAGDLLEPPLLLMMILMGGQGRSGKMEYLLEECQPDLKSRMQVLEMFMQSPLAGEGNSPDAKNVKILLQQGLLALEKGEYDSFFHLVGTTLENMKGSMDGLVNEMNEIKTLSGWLRRCLGEELAADAKLQTKMVSSA